ncbi:MAG: sel1 repeat family protein [Kordiimonadaceae bacterium]|nr:sel1 repeat family protein [Kordiimonadaceae bacterium]
MKALFAAAYALLFVTFSSISLSAQEAEVVASQAAPPDAPSSELSEDEQKIENALTALRDGNITRGTAILHVEAREGNAEAMFHLAELYRLGVGQDVSVPVALMFYRLASVSGHKRASLSLANLLFFEGDGTAKSYSEALTVWQTLSLEGDLESTYLLGMVYWNGDATVKRDPVRGYGLVWRAAEEGYEDAVQSELVMKSILGLDAREAAIEYGKSLEIEGFSDGTIGADLLVDDQGVSLLAQADPVEAGAGAGAGAGAEAEAGAEPETEAKKEEVATVFVYEKPDDWTKVWRLQVGRTMTQDRLQRFREFVVNEQFALIGKLVSDSVPSAVQPGFYRLVMGPMPSLLSAVNTCVALSKAGHACKVQAPE